MKKVITSFIVVCVVLTMVITGCSSKSAVQQEGTKGQESQPAKEPIVLRFAGSLPESHNISKASKYWCDLVEEMSNGEIKANMYYNCELGAGREAIEALQMGNLECTDASVAALAGFTKAFYVLNLPYVFTSRQQAYDLLDGELGEKLCDELKKVSLVGVSFYELGIRHLTNGKREVESPADLKGLKIRTMENPIHIAIWNSMGAQATPLAWAEVFTALQQGAMDGQENPITNIYTNKLYEVQKYITLTGHVYDSTVVLMSKKVFDGLDPKLQEVVIEAGRKATEYQRKLAQEQEQSMLDEIRKGGKNVITELSQEQILEFKKASEPVYEQFAKDIPEEMMRYIK